MKKYALIVVTALALGIVSGYSVSSIQDTGEEVEDQKKFCQEVEQGLQEEMNEGFVNCFDPTSVNFELREDIRNSTSISCICRKKVGEAIQEIKIAQPD